MAASHFKLDNLLAIVDHNGLQLDGSNREIMNLEPLADKWRSFGWHTIEINGHDFPAILGAFQKARQIKGQPTVIIAITIKGKGVSFMENKVEFHGLAPTAEEMSKALKELS